MGTIKLVQKVNLHDKQYYVITFFKLKAPGKIVNDKAWYLNFL
jgi:hypothetical protein